MTAVIIIGIAAVKGVMWASDTPYFSVTQIQMKGLNYTDEGQVWKLLEQYKGVNIFKIRQSALEDSLEKFVYVEKARVYWSLPKKLNVVITERVLLALYNTGTGVKIIDINGNFVTVPGRRKIYDLPIMNNCPAKGEQFWDAVNFLRAAKTLCPPVFDSINEVYYDQGILNTMTADNPIPIKIGKGDYAEKTAKLWALLNKPEASFQNMLYADLRFRERIFYKSSAEKP